MKRTIWINVGESSLPMRCTVGAIEKLYERYGSIEGFSSAIGDPTKSMSAIMDSMELFIAQGCAYENLFNRTLPDFPEGGYKPVPRQILECAYAMDDFPDLAKKVIECLNLSMTNSIKAKEAKGKKK